MTRLKTITVGFLFRASEIKHLSLIEKLQLTRMSRDADSFEAAMREVAESAALSKEQMEALRQEIMEIAERKDGCPTINPQRPQ